MGGAVGGGQGLTDAEKLLCLTTSWVPVLSSPLLGTLHMSGSTDSVSQFVQRGASFQDVCLFHVSLLYHSHEHSGPQTEKISQNYFLVKQGGILGHQEKASARDSGQQYRTILSSLET